MQCLIRLARPDDAAAISRVVLAALHASNARDYPPHVIEQVQGNFSQQSIGERMNQRQMLVATVEQQVMATASLDQAVVRSVFVDPSCQGRGMGRQLIAAIHELALQAGHRQLQVPSSITAQGFYQRLGYRTLRDEFHGAEHTIIMLLRLDTPPFR